MRREISVGIGIRVDFPLSYAALAYSIFPGKLRISGEGIIFWNLMDYRYLGYIFGGSNQNMSSGEGPGAASMRIVDIAAACQSNHGMNHTASHHENGRNAVVESTTSNSVQVNNSFLFFFPVCQKLESKVRTTYNQVADEIIAEFAGTHSDTAASLESDEKNIRRRVYDALNVLMALDIIARDKKEIWWKGLPNTNIKDLEEIKALRVEMMNRIRKKVAYLKDLEEQTSPHAMVEIEISEDMQLAHLDFNSSPFSLHDDAYILKLMRFNQQPESRNVSQSSFVQSSSSSSTSQGTKPFHWNSETHSLK
uniref:E2F/DP family winged-helix DNA-binding domain-containing protein n=1 Tax=Fagus sylvatica TaxID=28930 RepID=A0A2N9IPZ7_FAGSY